VRSKLTAVAAALTNILIGVCSMPTTEAAGDTGKLTKLLEVSLGQPVMQVRAKSMRLGGGAPGFFVAYSADFDVDPYIEMFFFPKDTLKLAVFTETGERLWQRDLGKTVVPGMHFCPVHACYLDDDGGDELFWGERCLELDAGKELFCADRDA